MEDWDFEQSKLRRSYLNYLIEKSVSSAQSAVGFEYKGEVQKHASQKGKTPVRLLNYFPFPQHNVSPICVCSDYSKGFGGKFGVEKEKVDKVALGYDYKGQTEKHQSQKGAFKLCQIIVLTRFSKI